MGSVDFETSEGCKWNSYGLTHVGNVRKINEDSYLNLPEQLLWVVADGMGGHTAGDVASKMIVDRLKDYRCTNLLGRNVRQINSILQTVNVELLEKASHKNDEIIGSTVAILLASMSKHFCICVWAGDSRIYRFRDGKLKQLTRDHDNEELLAKLDVVDPNAQMITRAVGADSTLELECQIFESMVGDQLLLCSDGLNKEVEDDEISEILALNNCDTVVQILLKKALERQGRDNISIILSNVS